MYRRCADIGRRLGTGGWGSQWLLKADARAVLLIGALLLAACGTTPATVGEVGKAAKADGAEQSGTVPVEAALPPEAVQQFDRAVVLMSSGDTAAAEQGLRALASAYPGYAGPLLNLGILQVRAGQLEAAEKTLKSALERNQASAAGYNQLGIVYRKQGRFKEADEAYQRALQIDPNYALAHLNLGVLCDLYLQQPQRALEAYERYLALAASPDAKVNTWVSELKKRIGAEARSARTEA